jgi:hypothetical protein
MVEAFGIEKVFPFLKEGGEKKPSGEEAPSSTDLPESEEQP